MKWGICRGLDKIEEAAEAGFDYIEPPVRCISPEIDAGEVAEWSGIIENSSIVPEAFNCFIPGHLKITGPGADLGSLVDYVKTVLPRAAAMGAQRVVFGSGGARGVPEGFPQEKALRQIEDFLSAVNPIAEENDIVIVIEPLCSKDCNIINLVKEAHSIADKLGLSNVKTLADLYHMGQDQEPYENLREADTLQHVHIAHPLTRQCPMPDDGADYAGFLKALRTNGYNLRISFECKWDDFPEQAPRSLDYLRSEWDKLS